MQIGRLPRIRLASLPTPLQEMPNLSKRLDGPTVFIKRDDLTGLAFGGNKTRKLEFLMADARSKGADVIVTGILGFQSNFLTQTAAAARKLGMEVVLVKSGPINNYEPKEYDGNHLLHHLLGADIKVRTLEHVLQLEEIAENLKREGHNPYIIPHAGSTPLGTVGYVAAMLELLSQAVENEMHIDYVVHGTSSAGTQAGLVLGSKALYTGIKVLGISVSTATETIAKRVLELANKTGQLLGISLPVDKDDVTVFGGYAKEGYGRVTEGTLEAIKLTAQTEGVILDPVYTGTAMAGLIDLVRNNYFTKKENVVFIHTGGTPALFPYKEPLTSFMKSHSLTWTVPPWSTT